MIATNTVRADLSTPEKGLDVQEIKKVRLIRRLNFKGLGFHSQFERNAQTRDQ